MPARSHVLRSRVIPTPPDAILLPLIFCATILVLLCAGEIVAKQLYPKQYDSGPCEYTTLDGTHYKPFCSYRSKVMEGPWATQTFNDCGYRTAESCAPRPAGSRRVVVVGSSTARGVYVPYPETVATRASVSMSKLCGGTVDFQNMATFPWDTDLIDRRIPEALALHPSAIVMMVGAYDISHLKDPPPSPETVVPPSIFSLRGALTLLRESHLFLLLQYYLYSDPDFHIKVFLRNGDPASFVFTPLRPVWQPWLAAFGDLLERITAQTAPANVPVLLFYIPERAQAALARRPDNPPGIDPFVLGDALRPVAARYGIRSFDTTTDFARAADFQSLFYPTDGHPSGGGHAAMAETIQRALLAEPAFAGCRKPAP